MLLHRLYGLLVCLVARRHRPSPANHHESVNRYESSLGLLQSGILPKSLTYGKKQRSLSTAVDEFVYRQHEWSRAYYLSTFDHLYALLEIEQSQLRSPKDIFLEIVACYPLVFLIKKNFFIVFSHHFC